MEHEPIPRRQREMSNQLEVSNPKTSSTWWRKFTEFFLVRLLVALLMINIPAFGLMSIYKWLGSILPFWNTFPLHFLRILIMILLLHGMYILYVRNFERRKPRELDSKGVWKEIGWGLLIGTGIIAVTHGCLVLFGYYHIVSMNTWLNLGAFFLLALSSGYVEELMFRGILFRLLEQGLGSILALIISSLLFGFLHAVNPNATLLSSLFIAIEAGLLLGALYMMTRKLWTVMAVHFAWNFTLGGFWSTPVSGISQPGLFETKVDGPTLLTGGEFGIEASILTVIVAVFLGGYFLFKAISRGRLVPAPWRRPGTVLQSEEAERLETEGHDFSEEQDTDRN